MAPKNWQHVKEVFHEALRHDGASRDDYLDNACRGDIEFRVEVESLLISLAEAQTFLEQPVIGEIPPHPVWQFENGRQISHYRIVSPIGIGGMGEVYLAHDLKLNRRVALKVLSANMTADRDRLRRFQREAEVVSALNHPNILTIFEFDADGDRQLFASEYVKGETLRERIKRGPIPPVEALDVAIQTVSALQAAHDAHVIHRDIKPENIMIRDDGYVKILDFGLAKLSRPPEENENAETRPQVFSRPGIIMGTTAYMSPEQARGRVIDARTDIFSFGVVLYEMLSGKPLFSGETNTDVIAAIIQSEPPPISKIISDVTPEFDLILSKALEKDRNDRYQTAGEALSDLKELKHRIESGEHFEAKQPYEDKGKAEPATTGQHFVDASKGRNYAVFVAVLIAIIVIAGLGIVYWFYGSSSAGVPEIDSIAILPFVDESGNPDTEYLSDGISESLINNLSQLPDIKVIARSSSFRYKGKNVDPLEVAQALGVQAVVNGRLLQRGDQLLVNVELLNAREGTHLWGGQFIRKAGDILTVQKEISRQIAERLRLRLTAGKRMDLARHETSNPAAYELVIKGRFYRDKGGAENGLKAVEYFKQAIALDPDYALAQAELSGIYRDLVNSSILDPKEFTPKAEAAARKAMELDDTLPEAHLALGGFKLYNWDWAGAEQELTRALELNPNLVEAHGLYSFYLSISGRHEQAIAELKRVKDLDPLSSSVAAGAGYGYFMARRYDEAVDSLKEAIELDHDNQFAKGLLATTYGATGAYADAIVIYNELIRLGETGPSVQIYLGAAYAKSGERTQARSILMQLEKRKEYVSPGELAVLYAALGEHEKAITSLERGYAIRDSQLQFLVVEPLFDPLRSDPRFEDLVRRIGLK